MDLNVDGLDFDPNNEHPARQGISEREIIQVWQNDPRFFRNKEARSARYLMVGRTFGGRLLSVTLAESRLSARTARQQRSTARPNTESAIDALAVSRRPTSRPVVLCRRRWHERQ